MLNLQSADLQIIHKGHPLPGAALATNLNLWMLAPLLSGVYRSEIDV